MNHEFSLADMGDRFVRWMNEEIWTPHGDVFDMGGTTATALRRIAQGTPAAQAGGLHEDSNGNGSLMRILPAVLRFADETIESYFCQAGSNRCQRSLTVMRDHRMACVFYGLMVRKLLLGCQPQAALDSARTEFKNWYERSPEFSRFNHILEDDLVSVTISKVKFFPPATFSTRCTRAYGVLLDNSELSRPLRFGRR